MFNVCCGETSKTYFTSVLLNLRITCLMCTAQKPCVHITLNANDVVVVVVVAWAIR